MKVRIRPLISTIILPRPLSSGTAENTPTRTCAIRGIDLETSEASKPGGGGDETLEIAADDMS